MQKKRGQATFLPFLFLILYKKVACPLFSHKGLKEVHWDVVMNSSLPNTAFASISKYP